MTPGLNEDLTKIDDSRKTAVIDSELERLNIDLAALQETRLPGNGSLKEKSYTFFWQGTDPEERREYGVGFAIKNSLLHSVEHQTNGTERLLHLRLHTDAGTMNIISAYAPTLTSSPESKDAFYDDLELTISNLPNTEQLLILGDFNARVGATHEDWPSCLGHFGVGRLNENGQRLLELCCRKGLCITNTYFKGRPMHKVSWMHPRSRQWHQLDLVLTKKSDLKSVLNTRSYHSADCDTDHTLVMSTIKARPTKREHSKTAGATKINIAGTKDAEQIANFQDLMHGSSHQSTQDTASARWEKLSKAIHKNALDAFGKKEKANEDWYEANKHLMDPLVEAKRQALLRMKQNPTLETTNSLRTARQKCRDMARNCADKYWNELCSEIERASSQGDIRAMYEGIKRATGPAPHKSAPLKSKEGNFILEREKQMERWVEHYLELYSTMNTVSLDAIDSIIPLPEMAELDEEPSLEELRKAIRALKCGKAPGSDGIPPEVIKRAESCLLPDLYELLLLCWNEGEVPQSMRDAKIITLYKNKGDRSDCNNYRGISLMSIVGKVFARILLPRLQTLANRVYPEAQCGFRAGRSTTDMVFSVRQLQEKCREQRQPLYIAFVDLTKAFDLVSRSGLFSLLKRIGCPPKLLSLIESYHNNMQGTISFNGGNSQPFKICSGVKQGCVLAPTLFGIFFSLLLQEAFQSTTEGVLLHTRHDGKLLNLARLRAKTKVKTVLVREMLFADDAAFVSHTEEGLQELINSFSAACDDFGLTISIKKTEILAQEAPSQPTISINGQALNNVKTFKYLGSTVSDNLCLDNELNSRIGKAAGLYGKLQKRVWDNKKLRLKTKMRVYSTCVISTLLYGSETWPAYARQEARLNTFHLRCLRRTLAISWRDKVTNQEVLSRAGLSSIQCMLSERRLRWLGHVRRMGPERLPKDLLYGQLATGTRSTGRPYLRFKDVCKRDLKAAHITVDGWEKLAEDRIRWRSAIKQGCKAAEEERTRNLEEKRQRRKASQSQPPTGNVFICFHCS